MILEIGDYFVVSRGKKLYKVLSPVVGDEWKNNSPDQIDYDRSEHGIIFKVEQIEHIIVAARAIAVDEYGRGGIKDSWINKIFIFNLEDIVVMTVSKSFVDLLTKQD